MPKEIVVKLRLPTEEELAKALENIGASIAKAVAEIVKIEVVELKPEGERGTGKGAGGPPTGAGEPGSGT